MEFDWLKKISKLAYDKTGFNPAKPAITFLAMYNFVP